MRLAEIAVLKAHIINYAKTRPAYDAYRKTGYSKRFLETHRTEITPVSYTHLASIKRLISARMMAVRISSFSSRRRGSAGAGGCAGRAGSLSLIHI